MNIYEKLSNIQQELKAPKNQYNNFGGYSYRSCEDILEAVKPLLKKNKLILQLDDEIVEKEGRYYIRAVARLVDIEQPYIGNDEFTGINCITNIGWAREEETKKGMDGSQITGASSSYARKYALNGLFLIDDVKDSDTTNTGSNEEKQVKKASKKQITLIEELVDDIDAMLNYYDISDISELTIEQASDIISKKMNKE